MATMTIGFATMREAQIPERGAEFQVVEAQGPSTKSRRGANRCEADGIRAAGSPDGQMCVRYHSSTRDA
jgi:hypothetical protein